MDQLKYWPCKPSLSCSNVDVVQSAPEQHYVKCATMFFKQVWGSDIDFQVEAVHNGGYKARVMMGQLVWCSCIHSSRQVAINAAAKTAVELAMQKASRHHNGLQPHQRMQDQRQVPSLSRKPSLGQTDTAFPSLLSPVSPVDTDNCDQGNHAYRMTPEQAKLQHQLLMELLGSMSAVPASSTTNNKSMHATSAKLTLRKI